MNTVVGVNTADDQYGMKVWLYTDEAFGLWKDNVLAFRSTAAQTVRNLANAYSEYTL